ncbi:MAG: hypothetical protein Q8M44_00800, partial [bacterium]|nr:hypothetical protein [bacterium]
MSSNLFILFNNLLVRFIIFIENTFVLVSFSTYFALTIHLHSIHQIGVHVNRVKFFQSVSFNMLVSDALVSYEFSTIYLK